jgi:magnesium transporter
MCNGSIQDKGFAMMEENKRVETEKAWEGLAELIRQSDEEKVSAMLKSLGPGELARTVLRLDPKDQNRLLGILEPREAADVVREVGEELVADVMEDLSPDTAAAIVDELPSDEQADLLGEMDAAAAHAVMDHMAPDEAAAARELLTYKPDSAGGLMSTEYLAYSQTVRVSDVLKDLSANRDQYADYDLQYVFVTDDTGKLTGVLQSHDLIFAPHAARLEEVMVRAPLAVQTDTPLEQLEAFFDEHHLLGVPVTNWAGRLMGVVLPEDVEDAAGKRANRTFLRVSGIVAGEEIRSMPLYVRAGRRVSWLSINVLLNVIAASVIAFYQDTIQAAVALAVFLPIISDMSGCSGGQAVAVSIRELAMGLIRPREIVRVLLKEAGVGFFNGLALGILLAAVAVLWKGNIYLGLVVGVALAVNTLISVCLGGVLPLLLRRAKVDPALLSGPILTTVTDTCGFFLVLSLATVVLPRLVTG